MLRIPFLLFFLATSALSRGALSCAGTPTTTPSRRTTTTTTTSAPAAQLLADVTTDLAGGELRARLPAGAVQTPDAATGGPQGLLLPSTHVVQRESGELRIVATDTGEKAGEDFRERAANSERAMRCQEADAELTPSIDATVAGNLDILGFTSSAACPGHDAPDARLWVRTAERSVHTITFTCTSSGCLPDRAMLLATFVASLRPGVVTTAPAGTRSFGPSETLQVSVSVPAGYFVRAITGEDTSTYEVFRRQPMGVPWESASFTFMFSPSPNSLRDDYGRIDARIRTVRGTVAGRRMRFLEIRYGERTERFVRMPLSGVDLDVGIVGASSGALSELRTIVARAHLPRSR